MLSIGLLSLGVVITVDGGTGVVVLGTLVLVVAVLVVLGAVCSKPEPSGRSTVPV